MKNIYYNFMMSFEQKRYFFLTKTNIKRQELLEMNHIEMEEEFESFYYFYKQENNIKDEDNKVYNVKITTE